MEFCYFTNERKVYDYLKDELKRNVTLIPSGILDEDICTSAAQKSNYKPIYVMYEDKRTEDTNKQFLIRNRVRARYYSSAEGAYDTKTGEYHYPDSVDEYIDILKTQIPVIENTLHECDEHVFRFGTGYRFVCGNCHEILGLNVKYCPGCGTKREAGRYEPYTSSNDVMYGAPFFARFKCPKCNRIWYVETFKGIGDSYCTECGTKGEEQKRKSAESFLEWMELSTLDNIEAWIDED